MNSKNDDLDTEKVIETDTIKLFDNAKTTIKNLRNEKRFLINKNRFLINEIRNEKNILYAFLSFISIIIGYCLQQCFFRSISI